MATVHDVAKLAGVSLATVSRTLNEPEIVRKETRKRVLAAIKELDFVPASSARALRKSKAGSIGIVLPQISNPFFPSLIEAASIEAECRDYSVLVRVDEEPLQACYQLARSGAVDGIALVDRRRPKIDRRQDAELGVPVIAFDRIPCFRVEATYQVDNVTGARSVTEHLLSRGAQRLLHICGLKDLDVTRKRLRGFYDGIGASATQVQETLIKQGDFSPVSGYKAVEEALKSGYKVEGIFAANDLMAVGAMQALSHNGLTVPGDVLVAGFDGLDLGKFVMPSLTTLAQPLERIATAAVTHLLDHVTSQTPNEKIPYDSVIGIKGKLVVRDSTTR